jgi:chemotaxis protein methyltransferase WspC
MVSECQGQSGTAAGYWRRCVYLEPGHYDALCHLALLAERSGDGPQAAALRQRAARIYQRRHTADTAQ